MLKRIWRNLLISFLISKHGYSFQYSLKSWFLVCCKRWGKSTGCTLNYALLEAKRNPFPYLYYPENTELKQEIQDKSVLYAGLRFFRYLTPSAQTDRICIHDLQYFILPRKWVPTNLKTSPQAFKSLKHLCWVLALHSNTWRASPPD